MASKGGNNNANKGKKRKQFLPYNKAVKKKGAYPLCPGVKGFFITCDGGREFQAAQEAINVIDSFYEEIIEGKDSSMNLLEKPCKPQNKKIKFSYSESSSSDDESDEEEKNEAEDEGKENVSDGQIDDCANKENSANEEPTAPKQDGAINGNQTEDKENVSDGQIDDGANKENSTNEETTAPKQDDAINGNQTEEKTDCVEDGENQASEAVEPPEKKQCLETDVPKNIAPEKVEEKSIDKLIEAELKELGDKSKRRFSKLDSGCNGVVFVQMRKRDGDPSPKHIVQHMMTSAAATRKHMSRFILRVLPIEVSCYASEEEIARAIKPLVEEHFPAETENPHKYAVLYDARANTGVDRMKIIDAVAKCIPAPHTVDLKNPDKNIVVQIVRTVCLIGVIEKYKELSKYNLRELTSSKR